MGVEAAGKITDINPAWPLATDGVNAGDDHLRNLKSSLQTSFPNINAAVTLTPNQLNALVNVSGNSVAMNPDMDIAQRGALFTSATQFTNNDGDYTLDGWFILTDGNDIVDVSQSAQAPTGGLYSLAMDVETVNKKFGGCQILEQKDCIGKIGNTCVLSFQMKVSSTTKLDNIKAAIVSWSGTADAPTHDIVSAWGAEGTNPTLAANWTYENVPVNLNPTTSFARYSVSAAVDTASAKNIALFIWSDVTDTTLGDLFFFGEVGFELGSLPTAHKYLPYADKLARCQRYLPGVAGTGVVGGGFSYQVNSSLIWVKFPVTSRIPVTGLAIRAASDYTLTNGLAATGPATNVAFDVGGTTEASINVTTGSGSPTTAGDSPARLISSNSAAFLLLTGAEL